jgi:DNA-binding transcriptional LysR family regulator
MVDDDHDAVARLAQRVDLITLRLFVAVCEDGSLSRAANRLLLATSAASKRLNNLEHTLRVKLFVRQHRGMSLTPAGTILLRHVRIVIANLESMLLDLEGNADHISGKVTLLANPSSIVGFLPEDIQAFFGSHRQIRLELEERSSAEVVRGIEDGVADIGICSSGASTRALTTLPYRRDRLVVAIPAGHSLAAYDALAFVDTLAFDHVGLHAATSIFRQSQRAARQAGLNFHVRTHVPSFDAVCRMVQAGVGISLIPDRIFQILGQAMGLRAIPLLDVWAERELLVVVRSPAKLAPAPRLMFDHLTGTFDGAKELCFCMAKAGLPGEC